MAGMEGDVSHVLLGKWPLFYLKIFVFKKLSLFPQIFKTFCFFQNIYFYIFNNTSEFSIKFQKRKKKLNFKTNELQAINSFN